MAWVDTHSWVALDGEGVGDDYVLLDSSLDDYPALYSRNGRLSTLQCLDWLWGLGYRSGESEFCIYGAGYDFNNWMRDIPLIGIKELASGNPIQVGDYVVHWTPKYAFDVRKLRMGLDGKALPKSIWGKFPSGEYQYKRIQYRAGNGKAVDKQTLRVWDVLPFWQTSFENALDATLGDDTVQRELIAKGKELRGKFTHEIMDFVREYNKAELKNLVMMMERFEEWLAEAGVSLSNYNGPGSIAKKLIRSHPIYPHNGRYSVAGNRNGNVVKEYRMGHWTPELWDAVLRSYAGGRNEFCMIGRDRGTHHGHDIISAHPSAMPEMPCLTHGRWDRVTKFEPGSFGLWRYRYDASKRMPIYPFFHRDKEGAICYPARGCGWAMTPEVEAALDYDPAGVSIEYGYAWRPDGKCDNAYPFHWITDLFAKRREYKASGQKGASQILKLGLNSIYGSLAQARGGTEELPPYTQQLFWASWITSSTRAKLFRAAALVPESIAHMATDGLISMTKLDVDFGVELGQWEHEEMNDLTVVQYGCYRATVDGKPKIRTRGLPASEFDVEAVYAAWAKGLTGIPLKRKLFTTHGLVANGQYSIGEWCSWKVFDETFDINPHDYRAPIGKPSSKELIPVVDTTWDYARKDWESQPYQPHWGKGEWIPEEWVKENLLAQAFLIAMEE